MNFKLSTNSLVTIMFCALACKKELILDSTKLTDSDGNVYNIVQIGNQSWIDQNYKGLKYRNGDPIPLIENGTQWSSLTTGACSYYDNLKSNGSIYGVIYNFYAINDSRNVAPLGWHVATKEDWKTLSDFLGGEAIAGAKLKTTGTSLWASPNTGANNESLFSAVPGGYRNANGNFESERLFATYWTSSEDTPGRAWYYSVYNDDTRLEGQLCNFSKEASGQYVRLVKD